MSTFYQECLHKFPLWFLPLYSSSAIPKNILGGSLKERKLIEDFSKCAAMYLPLQQEAMHLPHKLSLGNLRLEIRYSYQLQTV